MCLTRESISTLSPQISFSGNAKKLQVLRFKIFVIQLFYAENIFDGFV